MVDICQRKKSNRPHVRTACINCKKAHLACDAERPCKRCISVGKTDSCYDIQHKKRGRPKIRDKLASMNINSYNNNNNNNNNNNANTTTPLFDTISHHESIHQLSSSYLYPNNNNRNNLIKQDLLSFQPSINDSLTPFLPFSSSTSTFDMTKPTHDINTKINEPMMTIFLTTEMCCTRVSDECIEFIGYHPKELAYRSLYDYVTNPLELHQIHQQLEQSYKQQQYLLSNESNDHNNTTKEDDYYNTSPRALLSIANGSKTFKIELKLKTSDDKEILTNAIFYFGGGLGGNLCQGTTLQKLYIVCVLTKINHHHHYESLLLSSSSLSNSPLSSSPITTPPLLSSLLLNHDPIQHYSSSSSSSSSSSISSSPPSSSSPMTLLKDLSPSSSTFLTKDSDTSNTIFSSTEKSIPISISSTIELTNGTNTNDMIKSTSINNDINNIPISSLSSTSSLLTTSSPYTTIQTPTSFEQDDSLYSWLNFTFPSTSS